MPELRFRVRLPDGREESCYSPSLVVRELLTEQTDYPVYDFMARTRAALTIAGERVRVKYGFHCSGASDQLAALEALLARFDPDDTVRVLGFSGPTPS